MVEYSKFVHEYNGRWVVAEHRDGRYYAPMTAESRRLNGGSTTVFGPLDYVFGNAYHYAHRKHALAKARELFGEEVDCEMYHPGYTDDIKVTFRVVCKPDGMAFQGIMHHLSGLDLVDGSGEEEIWEIITSRPNMVEKYLLQEEAVVGYREVNRGYA